MRIEPKESTVIRAMRVVVLLFGIIAVSSPCLAWPTVKPIDRTFEVRIHPGNDSPIVIVLNTTSDKPAYRVECHTGDYEDMSLINFSGTFQCAVFALDGGKIVSWNLLAADTRYEQGSDWTNRGRMLSEQLEGSCAAYAEYGLVRHFRFRAMVLTLRFSNLVWERPKDLASFSLGISALADPAATTATAAVVHVSRPPRACGW